MVYGGGALEDKEWLEENLGTDADGSSIGWLGEQFAGASIATVEYLVKAAEYFVPKMWARFQEFWDNNRISSKIISLINSFFNVLSNPAVGSYLVAGLTILFSFLALWGQLTGGGFI